MPETVVDLDALTDGEPAATGLPGRMFSTPSTSS
jgi:hypothetical protein